MIETLRAMALCIFPANRQLLEIEAEFNAGCNSLAAIVGSPVDHVRAAALRVACESTHPNHIVPAHLYNLIYDTWRYESASDVEVKLQLALHTECEEGCRAKFYQYLGEQEEGKQ